MPDYMLGTRDADFRVRQKEEFGIFTIGIGGSLATTVIVNGNRIYFGALDTMFYCLDAVTGEKIWDFKTGGIINQCPSFHNDCVFFGSDDGFVYCVGRDGQLVWKTLTGGKVRFSSPLIVGETLYVGSYDGFLYAMSVKDGSVFWKFRTGSHIVTVPAAVNNSIVFGSCDNHFYSVTPDGELNWKHRVGDVMVAAPSVTDAEGNPVWNLLGNPNGPVLRSSPKAKDAIVLSGCDDGYLYALSANEGKLVYRFFCGDKVRGSCITKDGRTYFGSYNGYFYSIKSSAGNIFWKKHIGSPVSLCTMHDETIFFGDYSGLLHVIKADGTEIWNFKTGGPVAFPPTIKDGTAYFGSWDTHLYALDITKRQPVWTFRTGFAFQSPVRLPNVTTISENRSIIDFRPTAQKTFSGYEVAKPAPTNEDSLYKPVMHYTSDSLYDAKKKKDRLGGGPPDFLK